MNSCPSIPTEFPIRRGGSLRKLFKLSSQRIGKTFPKAKYLTPLVRDKLTLELSLSNNQVITWFQNRRAKLKREVEELHRDLKEAHKIKEVPS